MLLVSCLRVFKQKMLTFKTALAVTCSKLFSSYSILTLIDEFDAPVTNAMFDTTPVELRKIISLRDQILGNVLKNYVGEAKFQFAVLTGIADIVCSTAF